MTDTNDDDYFLDDDEDADFADDLECTMCNGEGQFFGSEIPGYDPGWHIPDRIYPCPSCNGSGRRSDMTIW